MSASKWSLLSGDRGLNLPSNYTVIAANPVLGPAIFFTITYTIIATLLLRFAAAPLEANESYAWTGWYWILIMGAGVVGSLTAFIVVGAWLVKRMWRMIRRTKTAS